MRLLARLLKRAVALLPFLRRTIPHPDWLVYKLDGHPSSEFYFAIFAHALAGDEIRIVSDEDLASGPTGLSPAPFIYIGHGNAESAYSSVGYTEGLRDALCDATLADKFIGSPQIWWSCYSAVWLRKCRRTDWFGYSTLIGVDPRAGQEQWWRDHLQAVVVAVINTTRGVDTAANVKIAATRIHEDAVNQYYAERRVSWISVLCARAFSEGADWHAGFGGRP